MLQVAGRAGQVTDAGVCRVSGIEGEIPWEVDTGDTLRYAEVSVPGYADLSAEYDPSTGEVEWYRGRKLDEASVAGMFGRNDIKEEAERKENVQTDRRRFGCLTSLIAFFALFGGCAFSSGPVVGQDGAVASQIAAADEGKRFGPYMLNKVDRVHRLEVSTSLTQSSVWVQAVLEDAEGGVVDAERELWDESGVDSDGSWHESDLNASRNFRLAKPGPYYVRLQAEPDASSAGANINFRLQEIGVNSGPLVTFGVIGLILGTVFWLAGAPSARQKLSELSDD
jgi:hypothetical protein